MTHKQQSIEIASTIPANTGSLEQWENIDITKCMWDIRSRSVQITLNQK